MYSPELAVGKVGGKLVLHSLYINRHGFMDVSLQGSISCLSLYCLPLLWGCLKNQISQVKSNLSFCFSSSEWTKQIYFKYPGTLAAFFLADNCFCSEFSQLPWQTSLSFGSIIFLNYPLLVPYFTICETPATQVFRKNPRQPLHSRSFPVTCGHMAWQKEWALVLYWLTEWL